MFRIPLSLENASLELTPRWSGLGSTWSMILLALLLLVPVLLVGLLARYELRLVRTSVAIPLLGLRLLVIVALWFVVAFEPTLLRWRTEEVPGEVLVAVDLSGSMDVVDPGQKDTRKELARKVLVDQGLLRRLGEKHQVKLFGFQRELWEGDAQKADDLFRAAPQQATDLRLPLQRAAEHSAQALALIVFSDGQHNVGSSPLEKVKAFDRPIYPVVLGEKSPPPDLAVIEVKAPDNAFKDTEIQVEARIKSSGMPGQDVVVELAYQGKPVLPEHKKTLKPGQDRVRFQVRFDELGTHALEVRVRSNQKEITQTNNSMSRVVRVAQDRARVLIVDDEARWEYHYLASALMRDKTPKGDPTLQVDRVLFHQPRLGLITEENLEKINNPRLKLPTANDPKQEDPLLRYDVIFLGDVAPENLPRADRQRLERYVAQTGGTLVLQAGKRSWPMEYLHSKQAGLSDPLVKMLPLADARPLSAQDGFTLGLTQDGQAKSFLQMESEPVRNQTFWTEMPKHFWGIVGKPKPGASVLAAAVELSALPGERDRLEKEQALIVQMPYGFGQVFYVGLDSTWRWRYRTGDEYHHHFWGQLVRWAAAERMLPAGNRLVRYGARSPIYRHGKEVDIGVRLSEEAGALPTSATPAVRLVRIAAGGKEEKYALVPLQAREYQASVLDGKVRDLPPGQYRIDLDIPELTAKLAQEKADGTGNTFAVLPPQDDELFDLSANWGLLAALAQESKGEVFTPSQAGDIVDRLLPRVRSKDIYDREYPWQDAPLVGWLLGALLTLLTLEWVLRKGAGLP